MGGVITVTPEVFNSSLSMRENLVKEAQDKRTVRVDHPYKGDLRVNGRAGLHCVTYFTFQSFTCKELFIVRGITAMKDFIMVS